MRPVQDVDVLSPAAEPGRTPLVVALATALVVIVADRLTKWWAVSRLETGPCREELDNCIDVVWTLRFHFIENRGAAFSSGQGLGPLFGVIAIVMTAVLVNVARKRHDRWGQVLFGLIAGGAVGNLIDRIVRAEDGILSGPVVDFIDFQWWPVFNVADAAVVSGVVLFLIYSLVDPEGASGTVGAEPGAGDPPSDGDTVEDRVDGDAVGTALAAEPVEHGEPVEPGSGVHSGDGGTPDAVGPAGVDPETEMGSLDERAEPGDR